MYTLLFDIADRSPEEWTNLTTSIVEANSDMLADVAKEYGFDIDDDAFVTAEEFRDSDAINEWRALFDPMMSYVHLLERCPSRESVEMCYEMCPDVTIIEMHELDACAIALNGAGMDMSDSIELAYILCDGVSPVKASGFYTISELGKKIVTESRKRGCEPLYTSEIYKIIDEHNKED